MTINLATAKFVGFWMRMLAMLVDSVVLTLILSPIIFFVFGKEVLLGDHSDPTAALASQALQLLLIAVAFVVMWRWKSATPGKMVITAKIVDANTGGEPSWQQCVVRHAGQYVSLCPCGLGFVWIAFDPRKQGWHDKMARTVVVYDQT